MLTATVLCIPVLLGIPLGRLALARLDRSALERLLTGVAIVGCVALVVAGEGSAAAVNWVCWWLVAGVCGLELGALPAVLASRG
jgi:hypothetical protein